MTTAPPAPRSRRWMWWAAAIVVGAGAGFGVWWWMHRLPPVHAVAILPIADMTPGKDQARFCDGLQAEILDALARAPGVKATASKQPDSDAVMESILQRDDGKLLLIAQLTRVADGHQYWSKTFRRDLRDASTLPLEAARSIARIREERKAPKAPKPHRPNLQAYEAYLAGRSLFRTELSQAIAQFDRATQADPLFGDAWAWLAIARSRQARENTMRPNEIMPEARDAAEHALAMAPDDAASHLAVGIVRLQYDWEWNAARAEFDRALQLAPGLALARYWSGRWQAATGHREQAIAEWRQALACDPGLAEAAGELAAVEHGDSAGGAVPSYWSAYAEAIHRDTVQARDFVENGEDIRVEVYVPATSIALMAVALKDLEGCFHWLEVAYNERSPDLPYLYLTPGFPVSDPRYGELKVRMKL